MLSIDERTVRKQACPDCGREYDHVAGFVYMDGNAHVIYYAVCRSHPEHEAWLDVVLGTRGEDDRGDHVTFSCQLRSEGAAAVDATVRRSVKFPGETALALGGLRTPNRMSYAAVGGPNQVVSASASPTWARSPTQATYPSGRINTAVGAVTAPSTGSSHGPMYLASII
jgi:hypothetical protein